MKPVLITLSRVFPSGREFSLGSRAYDWFMAGLLSSFTLKIIHAFSPIFSFLVNSVVDRGSWRENGR